MNRSAPLLPACFYNNTNLWILSDSNVQDTSPKAAKKAAYDATDKVAKKGAKKAVYDATDKVGSSCFEGGVGEHVSVVKITGEVNGCQGPSVRLMQTSRLWNCKEEKYNGLDVTVSE
uniref:Uncharacterized protein n=1 Tax=Zea mays TaxID=4577 RepID=A0A804MJD5_MAIZE